jgi:flagellum-specific ATP synthase
MYTVLVENDDMNDPVADTVRSILDGHIVLSRRIAASGHYPAIDVLESISRVMVDVTSDQHIAQANTIKEMLATYNEAEDLINIGAYVKGSNPDIDKAVAMISDIRAFQRQGMFEKVTLAGSQQQLQQLVAKSIQAGLQPANATGEQTE